jgi:hypothetical protein
MNLILAAAYSLNGTIPEAKHTGLTLGRVYIVGYEWFADIGGATLIFNMGQIFVPEILEGGQHGVGSRGAQRAGQSS